MEGILLNPSKYTKTKKTKYFPNTHVNCPDSGKSFHSGMVRDRQEWKSTWNKLSTSVRCTTILLSVGFFVFPPRGKSSSTDAMFDVVIDV